MKSISRPATVLIIALLTSILAGCADPPEYEPRVFNNDGDPQPAPLEFPRFPLEPIVVYEVEQNSYFLYKTEFLEGQSLCSLPVNAPMLYIVQYDRYGFVWEENFEFDFSDGNASIQVSVEGTPPFIIGGDRTACARSVGGTSVLGVNEGSLLYRSPGFNMDEFHESLTREIISLSVPLGKTHQKLSWESSVYDWRLVQVWLESREGVRNGNLSVHNEQGDLIRNFSFPLLGPTRVEEGPALLYPGSYTIELELERPATEPTEWKIGLQTRQFGEEVCRLDIEWDIC